MTSISRLNWSCSCGRYSWSKPRSSAGFTFCTLDRLDRDSLAVFPADVILDDRLKLFGDAIALQRDGLRSVDVDRGDGHLAGAGQADADVGVLGLSGAVHHAAHHRDAHGFHAGIRLAPDRHLVTQEFFYVRSEERRVGKVYR